MYRKVLVPLDGSRTATLGLNEAIRLAKHFKSKLRLIHVVDGFIVTPTLTAGGYVNDIQKVMRANGTRILKRAEALARRRGIAVDSVMFEIVGGRAAATIVEQAKKWHADIIVAGTHGRRGVSRLVMGSDAEQIARTSPAPVLLIRSTTSAK